MSLKNDLKNIVINEKISGPFISMYLPLYPNNGNYRFDDTEFNSLLLKAKKLYAQQFGDKGWQKYDKKIKDTKNDIIFDYAQSKSLAVIIGKEATYHYYLPRKVDLQVHVSESPYILPIISGIEFMPTYNILKISRSGFEMFSVKNGLVIKKNLPKEAPTSAVKALDIDTPDQKIRMEQRGGASYDQFRGNDVKSEAEQSNMERYFRIVDEYVNKHISLKDHLNVVLMATDADAGEFKKISHNQFLNVKYVITTPSIINHESLEKVTKKINEDFINKKQQNIEQAIDIAHSKKRFLDNLEDIKQAAIEGRLDQLIIACQDVDNEIESEKQIQENEIAIYTLVYGGQVTMINQNVINNKEIVGILRGI
ncbi:hypothetical protein [Ligilactobacillus cholophilus]|uniref:baeRF6 domain-containing protein n=1 Tax=Ligilactobacillus cholophilus TaxID=3050131 RepID=UPI0025B22DDA|nr:hypothetical protein [Ligilactobacillus cholophilus]